MSWDAPAARFLLRHLPWPSFGRQPTEGNEPGPLGKRLLWFAGLWIAGVACLGLISLAIKAMIGA